ncbi:hypothetical protein ACP_2758 [Acidobacterium capsulatum ATCC 51196]|uniref:Uncharacterized protein n=1 Tax=Acidobacterium capsulatum (strain ATCC 51196 / DSM 11244 / BCRC 80197 / JCM 7670 / NBRC 15755 / NCIMB 13165 / 161) TaxID=240015 RepID=C1F366_ACIC5|nr:hypothetical protein ACP_2758 [Acidobacterium capsulatum ATCC 51196]
MTPCCTPRDEAAHVSLHKIVACLRLHENMVPGLYAIEDATLLLLFCHLYAMPGHTGAIYASEHGEATNP